MPSEISACKPNPQEPPHKALIPEIKARSAQEAATLIAEHPAPVIAAVLLELNPGFAQDILAELPGGLMDAVLHAASPEMALQWRRNQTYAPDSIGRLMEPAYAVFHPAMTVAQTVERLRALIKVAFITYGYVTDESGRLRGLITMRDLLFAAGRRAARIADAAQRVHPQARDAAERRDEARARPPLPGLPGVRRRRRAARAGAGPGDVRGAGVRDHRAGRHHGRRRQGRAARHAAARRASSTAIPGCS